MKENKFIRLSDLYESMRASDQDGAFDKLEHKLVSGKFESFALFKEKSVLPVNRKYWSNWVKEDLIRVFRTGSCLFSGLRPVPRSALRDYRFEGTATADIVIKGEYNTPAVVTSVVVGQNKNRGGAPRKHDIVEFMICAFELIYLDNNVKSPAELRKRALEMYAERGHATPEAEWAREPINALWEARSNWNKKP